MDTIMAHAMRDPPPMAKLMRALDPAPRLNARLLDVMFGGVFGGPDRFVTHGKDVYVEMHDEIRRLVPKHQLLDYQLGEGWERLCAFLNVDVPDADFPRVNETTEFAARVRLLRRQAMGRVATRVAWWVAGVVGPVVAGAWYFYGRGA